MRLHRFFIQTTIEDEKQVIVADADLAHQLKSVFRLENGAAVILLDNSGFEFEAKIESLSKSEAVFSVTSKKENTVRPKQEIHLYAAMIKKDHFEWILEKATEIGVVHFTPVVAERSVKMNLNMERGAKIIKEASEQSGRGTLPTLHETISLSEALKTLTVPGIAFHLDGKKFDRDHFDNENALAVFIGPEGGWSDTEIEMFKEHSIEIFSLGDQVLRAETAAIMVPALLLM